MSQRIIFILAVLLALYGCSAVPLPSQFPLNSTTSLRDSQKGGFLNAQSISDEVGLQLIPGDVIYLRRWAPGVADPVQAVKLNRQSPSAFVDRVPLRHVKPDTHLYDYEREFLINSLTVNRSDKFQEAGATDGLAEELFAHEAALWNALVDNLWVKRLGESLVLTVRLPAVVAQIPDGYRRLFLAGSDEVGKRDREVASIEAPLASAYHALSIRPGLNQHYYKNDANSPALLNFLTVELSGAWMAHENLQEGQWTLEDWEESGICRADDASGRSVPLAVQSLWLKTHALGIDVVASNPTHDVILDLLDRSRSLKKRSGTSWLYLSIAREDLGRLTARDVRNIGWSTGGPERVRVVPNCQPLR